MIDGISIGIDPTGILVKYKNAWVSPLAVETCFQVENSERFKTKMTVGHKKNKCVLTVNAVNFLSGQNVYGPDDAHRTVVYVVRYLVKKGILKITNTARERIKRGFYDIHQMAFNMYVELDTADKGDVTDLLKTMFGGLSSHVPEIYHESYHLYSGEGFIVKNRTLSLSVYDKAKQIFLKKKIVNKDLVPNLDALETKLRCEVTVKYGYFSLQKRRMSWWLNKDWAVESRIMLIQALKRFRINYLMNCPNVFASDYTSNWKPRHKPLFDSWMKGSELSKIQRSLLYRLYAFDGSINAKAHSNILWALRKPRCLHHQPTVAELKSSITFPGKELLSTIYPIEDHLTVVADEKTLLLIYKACKSGEAVD